jgi:hypothetical protein
MKELTEYQNKELFELVNFQLSEGSAIEFLWNGLNGTIFDSVRSNKVIGLKIPKTLIMLWNDAGYITMNNEDVNPDVGFQHTISKFILNKEAFDYASFMKKPKFVRRWIKLWEKLIDDIPSLIWGFLGGTASSIVVYLLTK